MSHLADKCGLQEEMSRSLASSSDTGSHIRQESGQSADTDRAGFTLALVALTSQTLPWTVNVNHVWEPDSMDESMYRVILTFVRFRRSILQVHESATFVIRFVNAIQSTEISISVIEVDNWSGFYPKKESFSPE